MHTLDVGAECLCTAGLAVVVPGQSIVRAYSEVVVV